LPGRVGGQVVERHLRLVALQGDEYPAPRRPVDDGRLGSVDWLGDRFDGAVAERSMRHPGGDGRAGRVPGGRAGAADAAPDAEAVGRRTAPIGGFDDDGAPDVRWTRPAGGGGGLTRPARGVRGVRGERPVRGEGPRPVEGERGDRDARPARRPVRLTRRGRLVLLALVLFLGALVGFLGAAPGQAADPAKPAVTAVVEPGDTLWSFAERNLPNWQPKAAVVELKRLNDLEGYVIHPGQRLTLPARR
jgi:hypothetical protein